MGLEVDNYYQEQAYHQCNGSGKNDEILLIEKYKSEGREKDIQKALKVLKNTKRTNIPKTELPQIVQTVQKAPNGRQY